MSWPLHELLTEPVRRQLGTSGLFLFAWIIPYSVAVLALAVWAGPQLWRLGRRFRVLFGVAAALFLCGAVGVEMLGGRYYEAHQTFDLTYRLHQTVEETLEFCGLLVLIYTQLMLLSTRVSEARLQLRFGPRSRAAGERSLDHNADSRRAPSRYPSAASRP